MKKLIKDEMNIKDIINHIDLNTILYTVAEGSKLKEDQPLGNVIVVEYNDESILDLTDLPDLDYFNNDYLVLSITKIEDTKRYIYLKQIPMV